MQDYALYIADNRYSVPTLLLATLPDQAAAEALALRKLEESPHHLSVQVTVAGDSAALFVLEQSRPTDGARTAHAGF